MEEATVQMLRDMVGAPAPVVVMMRMMPWIWRKLRAVAHTLPYDAAVMSGFRIPRDRFEAIRTPVLIMSGSNTDARLRRAAHAVAGAIPGARHRDLAGQTHAVKPEALAPSAIEFFVGSGAPAPASR